MSLIVYNAHNMQNMNMARYSVIMLRSSGQMCRSVTLWQLQSYVTEECVSWLG